MADPNVTLFDPAGEPISVPGGEAHQLIGTGRYTEQPTFTNPSAAMTPVADPDPLPPVAPTHGADGWPIPPVQTTDGSGGGGPVGSPAEPIYPAPYRDGMITTHEATLQPGVPYREGYRNEAEVEANLAAPLPKPRGPMRGGFGGFAPIQPQYYPPDFAERVLKAHADAKEKLESDYFFNNSSPQELDDQLKKLDAERDQHLSKFQAFNSSFEGKQINHARHQVDAQGRQQELGARAQDAEAWGDQMRGLQMQRGRKDFDATHEEFKVKRHRMEQRVEAEMESYRKAMKDLSATTIDPERYWKKKGTAGQIGAFIAMGLGTAASIMSKTPNVAAAMIEKQIDRDIAAQAAEVNIKKSAVGMQGNLVGMMRQRLTDVDRIEEAAKAHIYAQLEQRMAITANSTKQKTVRLRAEGLRQEFADRKQGFEQQLELQAIAKAKLMEQQRAAAAAHAAQMRAKAAQEQALINSGVVGIWDQKDIPKGWKHVPGEGFATRGDLSGDAIKQLRTAKEFIRTIDGALTGGKYNLADRNSREQFSASLTVIGKNVAELGAISEADMGLINKWIGDPNSLDPREMPHLKLKQLKQQVAAKSKDLKGSIGLVPARMVRGQNKKGKLVPQYLVMQGGDGIGFETPYSTQPISQTPVQ